MSDAVSTLVDGMDWSAGGLEEGTAEAEAAKIALISYQNSRGAQVKFRPDVEA